MRTGLELQIQALGLKVRWGEHGQWARRGVLGLTYIQTVPCLSFSVLAQTEGFRTYSSGGKDLRRSNI